MRDAQLCPPTLSRICDQRALTTDAAAQTAADSCYSPRRLIASRPGLSIVHVNDVADQAAGHLEAGDIVQVDEGRRNDTRPLGSSHPQRQGHVADAESVCRFAYAHACALRIGDREATQGFRVAGIPLWPGARRRAACSRQFSKLIVMRTSVHQHYQRRRTSRAELIP